MILMWVAKLFPSANLNSNYPHFPVPLKSQKVNLTLCLCSHNTIEEEEEEDDEEEHRPGQWPVTGKASCHDCEGRSKRRLNLPTPSIASQQQR